MNLNDIELAINRISDGSEILEVKGNFYMNDISLFFYKDKIIIFDDEDWNMESRYDDQFIRIAYAALILETNRIFINPKEEIEYIKHKLFKCDHCIYYYVNDFYILEKEGDTITKITFFNFIQILFSELFSKGYGTDKENYFINDDKLLNEFKNFN
jgi:hypothetical protein